jgi:hypothetical protein
VIDLDDPDRVLNLVGVALVVVVVFSVVALGISSLAADQGSDTAPEADWDLTRLNDTYVRITHAGGEPVPTPDLTVAVDGRARHPEWTDTTLTEGDSAVLRADADSRITLLWEQSQEKRYVLQRWTPDGSDAS